MNLRKTFSKKFGSLTIYKLLSGSSLLSLLLMFNGCAAKKTTQTVSSSSSCSPGIVIEYQDSYALKINEDVKITPQVKGNPDRFELTSDSFEHNGDKSYDLPEGLHLNKIDGSITGKPGKIGKNKSTIKASTDAGCMDNAYIDFSVQ